MVLWLQMLLQPKFVAELAVISLVALVNDSAFAVVNDAAVAIICVLLQLQ